MSGYDSFMEPVFVRKIKLDRRIRLLAHYVLEKKTWRGEILVIYRKLCIVREVLHLRQLFYLINALMNGYIK